jgi:mono/diheme cytochrome c family protein
MKPIQLVVAAFAAFALAVAAGTATFAGSKEYTLPNETATLTKSPDAGYEKAEATCTACHSVDYITTQPRGKGKDFWNAVVNKMIHVYGAPVDEPDVPAIVDYLSKNY